MFIEKAKSFTITLFLLGLIAARHVIALCFLPCPSFPSSNTGKWQRPPRGSSPLLKIQPVQDVTEPSETWVKPGPCWHFHKNCSSPAEGKFPVVWISDPPAAGSSFNPFPSHLIKMLVFVMQRLGEGQDKPRTIPHSLL